MTVETAEKGLTQTSNEALIYKVTTTNWASSPSSLSVSVYDQTTLQTVTSSVMPVNSPSADGDVITLSPLRNLVAGRVYRVQVQFNSGGNTYETFFRVYCEI